MRIVNLMKTSVRTLRGLEADGSFIAYKPEGSKYGLDWDENSVLELSFDQVKDTPDLIENVYVSSYSAASSANLPPKENGTYYIVPMGIAVQTSREDFLFPVDPISNQSGTVTYKRLGRLVY